MAQMVWLRAEDRGEEKGEGNFQKNESIFMGL